MYKILRVSAVRSGHGEVRSPIIGSGFAVSVLGGQQPFRSTYLGIKMETFVLKYGYADVS